LVILREYLVMLRTMMRKSATTSVCCASSKAERKTYKRLCTCLSTLDVLCSQSDHPVRQAKPQR